MVSVIKLVLAICCASNVSTKNLLAVWMGITASRDQPDTQSHNDNNNECGQGAVGKAVCPMPAAGDNSKQDTANRQSLWGVQTCSGGCQGQPKCGLTCTHSYHCDRQHKLQPKDDEALKHLQAR